jgi:septal ring factor EnvC (AmiA/AmiB activator)
MERRSLGRTVWNLALALLNATLILLALCLWLGWSALSKVEHITDDLAGITETILPVRSEIRALTGQIAETRASIADLREGGGPDLHICTELEAQVARAEQRIGELNETLKRIEADLYPAISDGVEAAFGNLGRSVAVALTGLLGIEPPASQ